MASKTADKVITAMMMDTTNYVSGAKKAIKANDDLIASINKLKAAQAAAQSSLNNVTLAMPAGGGNSGGGGGAKASPAAEEHGSGGGIAFGSGFILVAALQMVGAAMENVAKKMVAFAGDALKEAASFNTLQLSFEALYGSQEKAAQMMAYLRDVSMTSAFHFKDLADAARGLSVAGLSVGRFLPLVQGFALAMGKVDAAGLEDVVGLLRRIQGGNTQLALGPRGFGRYGIGRAELQAEGGRFSNTGHFIGSANEAMNVLERVFTNRFAAIAQKVQQSSEVALSNWHDALQQATIDVGQSLTETLVTPIRELTAAMNSLRQSGLFKDMTNDLLSMLGLDSGMFSDESANYEKGTFRKVKNPGRFNGTDIPWHEEKWDPKDNKWKEAKDPELTPAEKFLIMIGKHLERIAKLTELMFLELKSIADFLNVDGKFAPDFTPMGAADAWADSWETTSTLRLIEEKKRKRIYGDGQAPEAPEATGIPGVTGDETNEHLKAIRTHTQKMAKHMDDRATAFGGGDIGRLGVTPAEMSNFYNQASGSSSSSIQTIMAMAGGQLAKVVDQLVQQAMKNSLRQGYVGGRFGN